MFISALDQYLSICLTILFFINNKLYYDYVSNIKFSKIWVFLVMAKKFGLNLI